MQGITQFDTTVFYWLNSVPHTPFLDRVFSIISGLGDAGFIWFVLGMWLVLRQEEKNHRFLFPLGIAGGFSYFFSEVVVKHIVARLRPSSVLDAAIVVGLPSGYSFPSTHATFAFALATVLAYKEPRWKAYLYLFAVLVCYSRIYLGHHYPGDVLIGGVLGWAIGRVAILWYTSRFTQKKNKTALSKKRASKKR